MRRAVPGRIRGTRKSTRRWPISIDGSTVSVSFLWDLPFFNQSGRVGSVTARRLAAVRYRLLLLGPSCRYHGREGQRMPTEFPGTNVLIVIGNWKIDPPSASELKAGATWFDVAAFEENRRRRDGELRSKWFSPVRRSETSICRSQSDSGSVRNMRSVSGWKPTTCSTPLI